MGTLSEIGNLIRKGIRAYHSSPHDFERFDLGKVGTGQGAQVYGHGIYFAENPKVSGQGGQYWQEFLRKFSDRGAEHQAAEILQRHGFDRAKAAADPELNINLRYPLPGNEPYVMLRRQQNIDTKRLLEGDKPIGPRTYEVNIKAQPEQFIDWDKPLSGQSAYVQDIFGNPERLGLKPAGPVGKQGYYGYVDDRSRLIGTARTVRLPEAPFSQDTPGHGLYRGSFTWRPEEASQRMREAGIPGVKYLDQGSRPGNRQTPDEVIYALRALDNLGFDYPGQALRALREDINAGRDIRKQWDLSAPGDAQHVKTIEQHLLNPPNQTYNYVVNDPSIIDILRKYAVPGAVGGAASYPTLQNLAEPQ